MRVAKECAGLAARELVVDRLGRDVHEREVVRALVGADVPDRDRVDVALHVACEGALVELALVVGLGLDHPRVVVERELRVDRHELAGVDDGVDALATAEAVLHRVGAGRKSVAEEVLEQQLAEAAARLRGP